MSQHPPHFAVYHRSTSATTYIRICDRFFPNILYFDSLSRTPVSMRITKIRVPCFIQFFNIVFKPNVEYNCIEWRYASQSPYIMSPNSDKKRLNQKLNVIPEDSAEEPEDTYMCRYKASRLVQRVKLDTVAFSWELFRHDLNIMILGSVKDSI